MNEIRKCEVCGQDPGSVQEIGNLRQDTVFAVTCRCGCASVPVEYRAFYSGEERNEVQAVAVDRWNELCQRIADLKKAAAVSKVDSSWPQVGDAAVFMLEDDRFCCVVTAIDDEANSPYRKYSPYRVFSDVAGEDWASTDELIKPETEAEIQECARLQREFELSRGKGGV